MPTRQRFLPYLFLIAALCSFSCGGSKAVKPSESPAAQQSNAASADAAKGESAPIEQASPTYAVAAGTNVQAGPPPPSAQPAASPSIAKAKAADSRPSVAGGEAESARRDERPGLATQFGEDVRRDFRRTQFDRETPTAPFALTTIWYNDAVGARAMAQRSQRRTGERAEFELFDGGLVASLVDQYGRLLPGFVADDKPYAIGEAGTRYAIKLQNRSDFVFEVVASVDGLSVIDGSPASFDRRGYILAAHDEVLIEGFRTSEQTVAVFRFGKVSQSYSVEMGYGNKNVGVIGIAFFEEKGTRPVYPSQDTRLRQDANPFPGEYAPRPRGR
jgi:hypothetical protein